MIPEPTPSAEREQSKFHLPVFRSKRRLVMTRAASGPWTEAQSASTDIRVAESTGETRHLWQAFRISLLGYGGTDAYNFPVLRCAVFASR